VSTPGQIVNQHAADKTRLSFVPIKGSKLLECIVNGIVGHLSADHAGFDPKAAEIAKAFGCELVVSSKGPDRSLRLTADESGCPTILYEAGEVFKFEPGAIAIGVRGVRNVLKKLGMLEGEITEPAYQSAIEKTFWIRSDVGGILRFHVRPGDHVKKDKEVATVHQLFSQESTRVTTPEDGIVLGMTMLPAVKPGEPICHIAQPEMEIKDIKKAIKSEPETLHRTVQDQIATSFKVTKLKPKNEDSK